MTGKAEVATRTDAPIAEQRPGSELAITEQCEQSLPFTAPGDHALGLFADIPNEDYHRGAGYSKSSLDLARESPAVLRFRKQWPKPETPAFKLGTAFHTILLEPDEFDAIYMIDPWAGSQRKEAKEGRAALKEEGKIILSSSDSDDPWEAKEWETVHRMRDAVMEHEIAPLFLAEGRSELTCYWRDPATKLLCRCRPDRIDDRHGIIVDLKTTADAGFTPFGKSVLDFRYHVQEAWYTDGLEDQGVPVPVFLFLAVEKTPPYGVGLYTLPEDIVDYGRVLARQDLDLIAACEETGRWPHYPPEPRELEFPAWAKRVDIH